MKALPELKKLTLIQAGKGRSSGVMGFSGWRMGVRSPPFKAGRDVEKKARGLESDRFETTSTIDKADR